MSLLRVSNLQVDFATQRGKVTVLRDLSFALEAGEAVGLVGESGSGKSVTSLAILQLLASNAEIVQGKIEFQGHNLLTLSERQRQKVRGSQISMIFQDPMTSLNPCYTVGSQLIEILKVHEQLSHEQAQRRALELMSRVGIPDPLPRMKNFPHEMSGGMSQRIMIAMAMSCRPKILIADEPTTALDVTIQSQILRLINDLRKQEQMAVLLVSHDLGVIAENTDRVMIMYAGELVEQGATAEIIARPRHPYTEGLLKCLPGHYENCAKDFRLPTIPGTVLNLQERSIGCQFQSRCFRALETCGQKSIEMTEIAQGSYRCLRPI